MSKTERFRLANPEKQVPMPDRGGRLFRSGVKGEAIDPSSRFYATMIADGDLLPVAKTPAQPSKPAAATRRPVAKLVKTAKGERA